MHLQGVRWRSRVFILTDFQLTEHKDYCSYVRRILQTKRRQGVNVGVDERYYNTIHEFVPAVFHLPPESIIRFNVEVSDSSCFGTDGSPVRTVCPWYMITYENPSAATAGGVGFSGSAAKPAV